MSTLPVVESILREADHPMSVREIVELSGSNLPTKSKTPDTVVARDLSMDIKRKGEESKFCRTSPGRYAIRAKAEEWSREQNGNSGEVSASAPATQPAAAQPTPISAPIGAERAATLSARPATNTEASEDSMPA